MVYLAPADEGNLALPWESERTFAVGEYCRARAVEVPNRVISSAKSWLSHTTVDRRAPVLPLNAPEGVEKLSPVEASRRVLAHLSEAFEHAGKWGTLRDSEVVLTVPASFDPAARDLTLEAAQLAGLTNLTLLEEPQAALYAWLEAVGDTWRKHLQPGDVVLVVDVGGGTSDFSAIYAQDNAGSLELVRVAVGEHILLGGDNMDLALAHAVRSKLGDAGKALDALQFAALTHACRSAKERLLSDNSLDAVPIVIASRGARLLGGSVRTELLRDEVVKIVLEGFFPLVNSDARPAQRVASGLRQLGLPFAHDAAVTRHLAAFLGRQAGALQALNGAGSAGETDPGAMLRPTKLLFNGGVFKSPLLQERLVACLRGWFVEDGLPAASVLPEADPDLAVAKGAAYYGRVRKGVGLRIRGGTARSYYVGLESSVPAVPGFEPPMLGLCVAPFGLEEGGAAEAISDELMVVVGEPVRFRFFSSSVRREDARGTLHESVVDAELSELSPIEVTLPVEGRRAGDLVAVRLRSRADELGTLVVEAVPTAPLFEGEVWRVELSVRGE
jgi:molecular chaperone DnaK (HSP70)